MRRRVARASSATPRHRLIPWISRGASSASERLVILGRAWAYSARHHCWARRGRRGPSAPSPWTGPTDYFQVIVTYKNIRNICDAVATVLPNYLSFIVLSFELI